VTNEAARPSLSVMLIVPDATTAVDWYKTALGAQEGGFTDPFGHRWSVGDRTPLGPFPQ
jgi:uncharacterized glyoxalase superfamily protein PhnB